MAIKVQYKGQYVDMGARRFSSRLRPSVVKLAVVIILLVAATAAWSQTQFPYTVLYKFPLATNPGQFQQYAVGNLVLDSSGSIFGATTYGGSPYGNCLSGCGVVFKLNHGRFTNVDTFNSFAPNPYLPSSGLLRDKTGNLYGETQFGGSEISGAVYTIDPNGNETLLASFDNNERNPLGGLIQDKAGDLLGVTLGNCNPGMGCGEIFKLDLAGNKTVLYTFPAGGEAGSNPESALVVDKEGNIYGTTPFGGASISPLNQYMGFGVLFKLSPDGTETVLHHFTGKTDGGYPMGLTQDGRGNLIGFTAQGGPTNIAGNGGNTPGCFISGGCGVIFKYDTQGNFSILHSFSGGAGGAQPTGVPLLLNGSIYGATYGGGYSAIEPCSGGCGVVFRLSPSGVETVLHTFIYIDGVHPSTGLVTDGKGDLFGATASRFIYRVTLPY